MTRKQLVLAILLTIAMGFMLGAFDSLVLPFIGYLHTQALAYTPTDRTVASFEGLLLGWRVLFIILAVAFSGFLLADVLETRPAPQTTMNEIPTLRDLMTDTK